MSFLPRLSLGLGALLVSIAIALSAWHAHGLTTSLEGEAYAAFGRGIEQQWIAGLGLGLCGLLLHRAWRPSVALAALLILVGAVLFCGDVYLGALRGEGLGVAPMGGSLSILAWLLLALTQFLGGPAEGASRKA